MEVVGAVTILLLVGWMIVKKALPGMKASLTQANRPTPKEPW
jgi:hypothetical protein